MNYSLIVLAHVGDQVFYVTLQLARAVLEVKGSH